MFLSKSEQKHRNIKVFYFETDALSEAKTHTRLHSLIFFFSTAAHCATSSSFCISQIVFRFPHADKTGLEACFTSVTFAFARQPNTSCLTCIFTSAALPFTLLHSLHHPASFLGYILIRWFSVCVCVCAHMRGRSCCGQ